MSFAPIPGITKSSVLGRLPASWQITTLTRSTTNELAYVANTSTAIPGTQLRTVVQVSSPGGDEVSAIQCQFSRQPLSIDSRLLAAARSCVNTVVPTDDQQAAARWIDTNAPALKTDAKKSEQLHDLQIGLQRMAWTFVILANTPIL